MPSVVSFTVETDGRLPDGTTLRAAIEHVDATAAPDWFLVNCAHPTHIAPAFADAGPWLARIAGLRTNASRRSHAELDDAAELDDGDPADLARAHAVLARRAALDSPPDSIAVSDAVAIRPMCSSSASIAIAAFASSRAPAGRSTTPRTAPR